MDNSFAQAFSRYAARALAADPELAPFLTATAARPYAWEGVHAALETIAAESDADGLGNALRDLRRRVFLHTLTRDLAGLAPLTEVCGAMTQLAEIAIRASVTLHTRLLAQAHGEPTSATDASPQSLIVIGMGKLGGGELNVSSDIDLIFVYPEEGETTGPRRIANREFFDRLGQRAIATLHDVTPQGYVFRVDMRLRPYGESGPLTATFAGLESYLVTQGRAWERYAWLKARALTGSPDGNAQRELEALIVPFVFRKYLDYDAYDGLRDVHRQIRDQGLRRDYLANVKLGDGGIREIEFIVQALQIVRGGREPDLRVRGTLPALDALEARGLLPPQAARALRDAYVFLRRIEHRLQYRDDQQTHQLPADAEERALLAQAMGFATLRDFDAQLHRHRAEVGDQFAQVFGDGERASGNETDVFTAIWDEPEAAGTAREQLAAAGYGDPDALLATLARVRAGGRYLQLPALSRQRFDALVPQLLAAAAAVPHGADAQATFTRLLALLEAVSRRSAYLALVIEHPPLLPRIAQLMSASAWAADYLTQHPLLLDELLDARVLLAEPDWDAWRDELARQMAGKIGDVERQMDTLRHFHDAHTFRLLAQDLGGRLTVERLADHLSALADVLLAATLDACWTQTAGARRRRRASRSSGTASWAARNWATHPISIWCSSTTSIPRIPTPSRSRNAMRGSPSASSRGSPATPRPASCTTPTCGCDPTAHRVCMVSSLPAFRKYQRETAWTWEHQALTRARFVAGDAAVGAAFETEREAILRLPRDAAALRDDVIDDAPQDGTRAPESTPLFDLKHDPGGMVDIEFAVQYLVLAHAHRHPRTDAQCREHCAAADERGTSDLLPADLADQVADAYRDYRRLQHQVRLTGAPHARVDPVPLSCACAARSRRCGNTSSDATGRRTIRQRGRRRGNRQNRALVGLGRKGIRRRPPCRWLTAMDGSGMTARWCRGATRPRTS